ncbi:Alpha/Beta hydrolase protein [Lentinula raphanica]|uniref:Carboxylic ester hydrolase n=1 Tax=Lentinula raphanica TaxID=153919 RepID=A0AA38P2G9_9AGAR|nr:Alpha/Beta hydrolase protein [Lentinula raphanica]KAJ3835103.1 Alpha/Beta hydrolase protein [Lentinula raphanica]
MLVGALLLLCASTLLQLSRASSETLAGDIIDTGYAKYRGNRSFTNTVAYLGIPYAEPPLGDRRFRAPLVLNTTRIEVETQGEIVDATEYPDFCVQGSTGAGDAGGAGTEDCLKVNIYAPFGAKSGDNLPVLVYFHGGGYVYGNPANWPFDSWIHQSPNVVIASVYYRLDSFGFLATPEFTDSQFGDFNVGFQDQIQSLRWLQTYVRSFGGDPDKVTINGQSAGGGSVELHLVAKNQGEHLFSGAIAQSTYRAPTPTPVQQQPLFTFYAEHAGCGTGPVTFQLACLRNASISALAGAQDAASTSGLAYNAFHPVLDGKIITDYPSSSILGGQFAKVPLIVGATSNETVVGGTNFTQALQEAFPGLTSTDLEEFAKEYPLSEFDSTSQQFQVATGESILICSREILGGAYAQTNNVWTYRYNQPNPTSGSLAVGHAAENWMMFNGINTGFNGTGTFTPMSPVEKAFAAELIAYWLSFVRSGDPNTFKLDRSPTWEGYFRTSKKRVVLQQPVDNSTTMSGSFNELEPEVESGRCEFVATKVQHEQN